MQNPGPGTERAFQPSEDSKARQRASRRYLLGMLAVPFCLFVLCIFVMPTIWLAAHTGSQFLASIGYGDILSHANCQVLIYGDSGAMVDADPATIYQRTGLTACNVAEIESVSVVNGTLPVDHFLSRNTRPKVILFLYAPEHYRSFPTDWKGLDATTGITYRLRYERTWKTTWLLMRNPMSLLSWVEGGLQIMLHAHLSAMSQEALNYRASRNGRYPMSDGRPMQTCFSSGLSAPDPNYISELRHKYESGGTRVLIDVLPLPDCDPDYSFYKERFQPLFNNELTRFPLSVYVDNGRLHMNEQGSIILSSLLADQINEVEVRKR